ncbi:MAG: hypothetical protein E7480_02805 [Ruminococcaceae bacterium]|nr:hypothetical protein [Oscillospiraceae bacterium]
MKRIFLILLVCGIITALAGCEKPSDNGINSDITSTTSDISDVSSTVSEDTSSPTVQKDGKYEQALTAIKEGKVGEAYRLLCSTNDERAPELLRHFVWQPLWSKGENPGKHTYDAKGYPATSVWGIHTIYFTWDNEGRLLVQRSEENSDAQYWEQYDSTYANGLLQTRIRTNKYGNGETETRTYDAKGNMIKRVYDSSYDDDDSTTTCSYDEKGNKVSQKVNGSKGYQADSTYSYNAAGQLTYKATTYNDGRKTETVERIYNDKGQCVENKKVFSHGTVVHTYAYGEHGEKLSDISEWVGEPKNVYRYTYDGFYRRTGMIVERDGKEINRQTITYDDKLDTCKFVGGGESAEYQLFYYAHGINEDLILNSATWVEYYDWDIK